LSDLSFGGWLARSVVTRSNGMTWPSWEGRCMTLFGKLRLFNWLFWKLRLLLESLLLFDSWEGRCMTLFWKVEALLEVNPSIDAEIRTVLQN
jgi:hypothetical protein